MHRSGASDRRSDDTCRTRAGSSECIGRVRKRRLVKGVVNLPTELDRETLGDLGHFRSDEVELLLSGAAKDVAPRVAPMVQRIGEGRRGVPVVQPILSPAGSAGVDDGFSGAKSSRAAAGWAKKALRVEFPLARISHKSIAEGREGVWPWVARRTRPPRGRLLRRIGRT